MNVGYIALGWILVLAALSDAFVTIVIPKTVERRFSFSGAFYNTAWNVWHFLAAHLRDGKFRLGLLSAFAPISLLFLFATWAGIIILGFALVHIGQNSLGATRGIGDTLYFSGETFFTLGYGDMTANHGMGRFVSVLEAGTGFAFLAIVIGYIPVLYNHFSEREHQIVLLDAHAGSEPSSGELLKRHCQGDAMEDLIVILKEWELWSAKQLEAFLSYPPLAFYRSQHDHQSWLNALTAILDTCSLIEIGFVGDFPWQSRLRFQAQATFAMGRHVIVDLAYIAGAAPEFRCPSRLPDTTLFELSAMLEQAGIPLRQERLQILESRRAMYEPYCISLARDLFLTLPSWMAMPGAMDNWQFSAWEKGEHF
jgi:hypothetical protein